ncbi:MAG: DUF983 domain-containing protein [Planctomycetia bacterium]|nr:DUF983 domain-containing protein [Planctomycetia bacterium]
MPPTTQERLGLVGRILRALRLRCPRCGEGKLFAGWFKMNDRCAKCDTDFRREPGFYLGSIYFNYGLTAIIVTATYVGAMILGYGQSNTLFWSTAAFCVAFPLWYFRYARSLWLAMDHYMDPPPEPK